MTLPESTKTIVTGIAKCACGLKCGVSVCSGGCGVLSIGTCLLWSDPKGMILEVWTPRTKDRPEFRRYARMNGLTLTDTSDFGGRHGWIFRRCV